MNHPENTEKEMKELIETGVMGKIKIGGLEKRIGREVEKKIREDEISKVNKRHWISSRIIKLPFLLSYPTSLCLEFPSLNNSQLSCIGIDRGHNFYE